MAGEGGGWKGSLRRGLEEEASSFFSTLSLAPTDHIHARWGLGKRLVVVEVVRQGAREGEISGLLQYPVVRHILSSLAISRSPLPFSNKELP